MLNTDKLNKLYKLATGNKSEQATPKSKDRLKLDKAEKSLRSYRSAYSDPVDAWSKWVAEQDQNIDADNADDVWNMAEKEFPGSQEQARDQIRNQIRSRISSNDPSIREQQLRNTMIKSPSWLNQELEEELRTASTVSSNQNLFKSKSVYLKSLEQKLGKFNFQELDPDVPADVHVMEAVKLEALGLLDTAKIVNGRFVVMGKGGSIQPAFSVTQEAELSGELNTESPEIQMIMQLAPSIVKKYVEPAMQSTQGIMSMENRASRGAALQMLRGGSLPVDRWGEALSLLNENQGAGINEGIAGLAEQNPNMNEEDAAKYSMDIISNYGGMV
jgi:hypothetical protein